jgi:hypothetical protein
MFSELLNVAPTVSVWGFAGCGSTPRGGSYCALFDDRTPGAAERFMNLSMDGYRTPPQGQRVRFAFVEARQDDCPFQAQNVS